MRTRVKFRPDRLGLVDGAAGMVAHRTPELDSARGALPKYNLDCPACFGVEAANHVLLHCPRAQGRAPGCGMRSSPRIIQQQRGRSRR